ncbi:MAG: hypothetical protein LBE86_07475 [Gemmobacter sp.]|nr:hypothetical protein [Gemmobacter sp.]
MVARLAGATLRMFFVMVLVLMPSLLLPRAGADGGQMAALVAILAGVLTFAEYRTTCPGLVEFRDASPFNRIRFVILFGIVFLLTLLLRAEVIPILPGTLPGALDMIVGRVRDFVWPSLRLTALMTAGDASEAQLGMVSSAAVLAGLVSLTGTAVFVLFLRLTGWPSRAAAFNLWINLPNFDPAGGEDVVARLERHARISILLGLLLPLAIPALVRIGSTGLAPLVLASPQTLIWTMTAWAFLPCSLFMRGIAMGRIAKMIREKRTVIGADRAGIFLSV